MNNPQQDQFQQMNQAAQMMLPLGDPDMNVINQIYGYVIQNANAPQIQQTKIRVQINQNQTISMMHTNPLPNRQDLESPKPQDTLNILYGTRKQSKRIDKGLYENSYFTMIPFNELDLTSYFDNITEEDFLNFYEFIVNGRLDFSISKIPTYLSLLAFFQLHIILKELISYLMQIVQTGQISLNLTARYDDYLLYHFVEQYTIGKPSYDYFLSFMVVQQWCLINSKVCWFIYNNEVSPLISRYNKDQFNSFFTNFYLQERLQYFANSCYLADVDPSLVRIAVMIHKIIQIYYMGQNFSDPNSRSSQAKQLFASYISIDSMHFNLFNQLKGIYDQQTVSEKLAQMVSTLENDKESMRIENLALKLIAKQRVWDTYSYTQ